MHGEVDGEVEDYFAVREVISKAVYCDLQRLGTARESSGIVVFTQTSFWSPIYLMIFFCAV